MILGIVLTSYMEILNTRFDHYCLLLFKYKEWTMDTKLFDNYEVANISDNEVNRIYELEESLKNASNKDIILIAYENKERTNG